MFLMEEGDPCTIGENRKFERHPTIRWWSSLKLQIWEKIGHHQPAYVSFQLSQVDSMTPPPVWGLISPFIIKYKLGRWWPFAAPYTLCRPNLFLCKHGLLCWCPHNSSFRLSGWWQPQKDLILSRQSLCNTKEWGIIKALCIHTEDIHSVCLAYTSDSKLWKYQRRRRTFPMSAPFESLSLFQLSTVFFCFFFGTSTQYANEECGEESTPHSRLLDGGG